MKESWKACRLKVLPCLSLRPLAQLHNREIIPLRSLKVHHQISSLLEARKIATQATEFHFDVHSYNFAYAAYYLLDTDRTNGAHVMITHSHKDKPTSWLFGSANQKDDVVYAHYPKDRVLIIEGKAAPASARTPAAITRRCRRRRRSGCSSRCATSRCARFDSAKMA